MVSAQYISHTRLRHKKYNKRKKFVINKKLIRINQDIEKRMGYGAG